MSEIINETALVALRSAQIGLNIYAMYVVWRWKPPIKGSADMLLPLLTILLALSLLNLLYVGRALASHDLIWWAYTIYDIAIPLAVIKFAGAGWCWPFKRSDQRDTV